jgi:hypothetical protein
MRRAVAVLLAMVVAACGPPTGNSRFDHPSPADQQTASPATPASPEASPSPTPDVATPSVSPSSSPVPVGTAVAAGSEAPCLTFPPAAAYATPRVPLDPELERMLPHVLSGCPAFVVSLPGTEYGPGGDFCILLPCGSEVPDLAKAVGVKLEDVHVGLSLPLGRTSVIPVGIRLPGVATDKLIPARTKAMNAYVVKDVQVGDRTVTWESTFTYMGADFLIIAHDDILFIVFYGYDPFDNPSPDPQITPDIVAVVDALP